MTPRIPGPEDEALEGLFDAIEVVDYMAGRALSAAYAGDMGAVKRNLHVLRFLLKHRVPALLGIKDGEDR